MNNGKLANIYDKTHYQLLQTCLHSVVPAGLIDGYIDVWTGLEYQNDQRVLTDGKTVTMPPEIWLPPSYPLSDASRANVGFQVHQDPDHAIQGIYNVPDWFGYNGVICEI
uniref:uncharacterized protein LOC120335720 n=1 Tax=Styela clava TaxID=7725 RepID=UPI00193A429C|nr:uncharacterized protein LOC120335720 [Styela clava]